MERFGAKPSKRTRAPETRTDAKEENAKREEPMKYLRHHSRVSKQDVREAAEKCNGRHRPKVNSQKQNALQKEARRRDISFKDM
jgi:hypothetical protein